jgi:hypothetical protein
MRDNQRVGSIRVNIVSADLQSRGYEVFREDGLCSFDLVAHKAGELLRVEVKGEGKAPRGNVVGCTSITAKIDCRKFDVMAVVGELVQGFSVRYLHSRNHTHTVASYLLTGADEVSVHTTKRNLKRAAEFRKETHGHQD